jgi:hypothetical protein
MGIVRRGSKWAIRYYGPDGRQRWETIGPNKKEAETVLAQRLYEVRSGSFPSSSDGSACSFVTLPRSGRKSTSSACVSQLPSSTSACFAIISSLPSVSDLSLR